MRHVLLTASITVPLAFSLGCSKNKPGAVVHEMGDRVQVGSLIYNVLEADWKSQLGDPPAGRVPKNRFLVLRLTVTNSGGHTASIPTFVLEDSSGKTYPEEANGDSVPGWFGIVRRLSPAQTDDGRVLFDVPPASYKLRVSADSDLTQTDEIYALVRIPLALDTGGPGLPAQ